MGDREVKQPPAGHFWKQKTDVPDHAKQEGNDWVGPPREHSVRFPGLTLVVASQRPHCCMEQRVTHWEVLTGTVGSEAQVDPHGRASLPSITSASTSGSLYTPSARYAWSMFSMTAETCRRRQPSRSCPTSAARWPVVRTAAPRIARPRSRGRPRLVRVNALTVDHVMIEGVVDPSCRPSGILALSAHSASKRICKSCSSILRIRLPVRECPLILFRNQSHAVVELHLQSLRGHRLS